MDDQKRRAPAATATIKIIECLAEAEDAIGLSEISSRTNINKNMLSRALSELTGAGWVIMNNRTGQYSLSLQLFRLSSSALKKKTLTCCADKYLKKLNDYTGECIQLAVLYEDSLVYIAQMESKSIAGIRGQVGASYPLDTTAPGKVFKAFRCNDPSLSDVIINGYAIDREEYGRGVLCLAAPVFDYTGNIIAAVNIASLTVNHSMEEMIGKYAEVLIKETGALSHELGYREIRGYKE